MESDGWHKRQHHCIILNSGAYQGYSRLVFGLLKRAFRCTRVGYLKDIVRAVVSAEVNHAQLVGAQDGTVIVPTYNWADYFDPFFKQTAFQGIKAMHHMRFSRLQHGKAYVKSLVDSQEEISLLKDEGWQPDKKELPQIVHRLAFLWKEGSICFTRSGNFVPQNVEISFVPSLCTTRHHQSLQGGRMAINFNLQ